MEQPQVEDIVQLAKQAAKTIAAVTEAAAIIAAAIQKDAYALTPAVNAGSCTCAAVISAAAAANATCQAEEAGQAEKADADSAAANFARSVVAINAAMIAGGLAAENAALAAAMNAAASAAEKAFPAAADAESAAANFAVSDAVLKAAQHAAAMDAATENAAAENAAAENAAAENAATENAVVGKAAATGAAARNAAATDAATTDIGLSRKQQKLLVIRSFRKEFKERANARAAEHQYALNSPFTDIQSSAALQSALRVGGVNVQVTYTNQASAVASWCTSHCIPGQPLGMDTETLPCVIPGGQVRPPALLQLAAPSGAVLLFQCCHTLGTHLPASDSGSAWPQQLVDVFSDASIPKAGVAVNGDAACLRKWGGLTWVDFQSLVQLEDIGLKQQGSLKALAEELLFEDAAGLIPVHVEKDMTLTISDWEQYPLPQAQITYAAMDAIASLWLHESPELQVGTAAAKAVVVQDVAAKAVVVQDTANAPASAWKAMALKDIRDLRRCREDSNNDAGNYNRDAS